MIEAGKVGADTVLAQIVAMVPNARRSRAPIQDWWTVSAVFVPTVVGVAILAFVMDDLRSRPRIGSSPSPRQYRS
jgi:Cu+-exporting ATPase